MAMTLRADKGAILSWNEMDANFRACLGVHNLLHVQDKKTVGTNGGTFTSASWQTRTFNTIIANNIAGSTITTTVPCSITLPVGIYFTKSRFPGFTVGRHQSRFYNNTASAVLLLGSCEYSRSNTIYSDTTWSEVNGYFDILESSVVSFQHRCESTMTDTGLGLPCNFGDEIYSDIKIWKLS